MIDITGMHVCHFITLRVRFTTEYPREPLAQPYAYDSAGVVRRQIHRAVIYVRSLHQHSTLYATVLD